MSVGMLWSIHDGQQWMLHLLGGHGRGFCSGEAQRLRLMLLFTLSLPLASPAIN